MQKLSFSQWMSRMDSEDGVGEIDQRVKRAIKEASVW